VVILAGILAVAGYLRFTGLNWDEGQYIHPDEGHMRNTISLISWPEDLSVYFDTHQSPLNVRNRGHQYSYGTLPLFLTRATAEWLDQACDVPPGQLSREVGSLLVGTAIDDCRPGSFTGVYNVLVGRGLSGLADLGTLVLLCLIGRRLYGGGAGLLAAGLGAVTAFLIQQAHFFTVDSLSCFFVMVVALFSVRASEGSRWFDFALAGVGVGLAAACKVSSATAALLVLLAAVAWFLQGGVPIVGHGETRARLDLSELWRLSARLLLAGLLSLIVFRVAQPYAFEGPGFFGLRPSPAWFGRLRDIQAEQSGQVDLPSGRQWANRLPIVFPWVNMVVWGMGLPLGLAAWTGWVATGYQLLAGTPRGRKHLVLWGWATVLFVYLGTRWVKTMRYFLPLYPILLLFAASWLAGMVRSSRRWLRRAGIVLSSGVTLGAVLWGLAFFTVYLRPHPRIAASRWIFERIPQGVTVANEHWDWGLPLRIDGHDPFGGMYAGIEMRNYDEDTHQKRLELYSWLDRTDWIFLASNRLYASISRLPTRYPLTTTYYRALFAGELGFELEADFTCYPALGPLIFPDQENPFEPVEASYASQVKPITVRLPAAEEAFSVYDHPRVLLFRKTEDYSTELVRRVLDKVDLERVQHGRTPQQATEAPNLLRFETEMWAEQQAGGTWSAMFNRDGLLNRYPGLAAVAWWLVVTGLGLLAFPLLYAILPSLRDRGYGFSRILGLLLVAYLTWLAASLRVFPNTRATIVRMVALLALAGVGVAALNWEGLTAFLRQRWRTILWIEGLYAVLFAGWIGVRLLQPDLWHPVVGGEKPMDFAYLNAVMKSTWFPPYNPWLSGTWINYYYFGFVIAGTLIKLMGTVPAIGYNLVVPVIFAVTGVSAFSLAYSLFGGGGRGARLSGLAALIFTILLGNLGVVHLIRTKLIALGDVSFPSTIPGFPETVAFFHGLWRVVLMGAGFGVRPESWYWHPTRIVPASTGNPIAEFPAFSFLYGDLHAHMIAFPLTLFSLGLALHLARTRRLHWATLALTGLVIGALRATNTWDYPTYLVLGLMALGLGAWQIRVSKRSERGAGRKQHDDVRDQELGAAADTSPKTDREGGSASPVAWGKLVLLRAAALVSLTIVFYLPYLWHYVAGYDSVELWQGGTTPLSVYLWIHAILLFPVVTRLVIEAREQANFNKALRRTVAGSFAGALLVGVVLHVLGYPVALVTVPIGVLAAVLLFAPGRSGREGSVSSRRLLWLGVGTAMALSIAVEVVVLEGDIGRMNTVFKFYLQVWVLLSVAAATSLIWVWKRSRRWRMGLRDVWIGAMVLLVVGGGLFLPLGIRARSSDRMAPATGSTLDGMAFMQHGLITDGPEGDMQEISLAGDYHAIRWMQESIEGSPVIIEGLGRHEYLWANRVSIYTGLPTVVGWGWHQVQQRAGVGGDLVNWRRADVNAFYDTRDIARAEEILARYDVGYVYVGAYERAYYDLQGLEKFERMVRQGLLQAVYNAHGTTVYEVASQSGY
jgi:YYY domain-containing protein